MELFYILNATLMSMGISLGVGVSTATVVLFLMAIRDCVVDESERRNLGYLYVLLRVAMVTILVTTIVRTWQLYGTSTISPDTPFFESTIFTVWILLGVLYLNAILMTAKLMPKTFGPGIQAGAWYTLGTLNALPIFVTLEYPVQAATALSVWYLVVFGVVTTLIHHFVKTTKKETC